MVRRFIAWLGPLRAWTLFGLFAVTGFFSLVLQAVGTEASWVIPVQNALILVWLTGSVIVVVGRLDPMDRRPLLISVSPVLLALGLGVLLPEFMSWFVGGGIGWLIVSQVLMRRNVRREYQQAIRYLRRSEYDQAVAVMNALIKAEPEDTGHLRFRAELYRLQGQSGHALKDYQRIVDIEPDSAVGYNGLAEVHLQEMAYEQALTYAQQAFERQPDHWVMPYNLGMIEDRLAMAAEAEMHLQQVLRVGVTDSRHRLLVFLWLARAYVREQQPDKLDEALAALRQEKRGLREWKTIFESEQAATLRSVLEADVTLAGQILAGAGREVFQAEIPSTEAE